MADHQEVLQIVMAIVEPFLPPNTKITPETPLADSLDSASAINVLLELETRLGITLGAGDLSYDNFQTCETLARQFSQGKGD